MKQNRDLYEVIIRTISGSLMALGLVTMYYFLPNFYEKFFLIFLSCFAAYEFAQLLSSHILRSMLSILLYPVLPTLALIYLHKNYREVNLLFPLTPFIIAALADTGGYFVGKLWGTHKICIRISPGKSWEGFAGSFVAVTIFLYFAQAFFAQTPLDWITHQGVILMSLVGLLFTAVAFLGGFFISFLKRRQGVKDSGSIIPGHGGILDRCDSVFFLAPLIWLIDFIFR